MREVALYKYGRLGDDNGLSILCELEEGERVAINMDPGVFEVAVFRDGKMVCGGGKMTFNGDSGLIQIGRGTDAHIGCSVSYYLANLFLTAKLRKHLLIHKYASKHYCRGYHFITPFPSEKGALSWPGGPFVEKSFEQLYPEGLYKPEHWTAI